MHPNVIEFHRKIADRAIRSDRGCVYLVFETSSESTTFRAQWNSWRSKARGKTGFNEEWDALFATVGQITEGLTVEVPSLAGKVGLYYLRIGIRPMDDDRIIDG